MDSGILYVVATPIGNLQDCTLRAIDILKKVDLILAEDTRHSRKLLNALSIHTPLRALHAHNEKHVTAGIVEQLQQGKNMALVSDAGTPLLSDPGQFLVNTLWQEGIRLSPLPGPSALVTAWSVAGFSGRLVFEGFLPAKAAARQKALAGLQSESGTLAFYEAPHRVLATLTDLCDIFGAEREVLVARELTKLHEHLLRDTLGNTLDWFTQHADKCRGEFVLLVRGVSRQSEPKTDHLLSILTPLLEELPLKQAVSLTAKISGVAKNTVYQEALRLRDAS